MWGVLAKTAMHHCSLPVPLVIHLHERARQGARELANTPEFAHAQQRRKRVEALFAELKNQIGLGRRTIHVSTTIPFPD